MGLAGITTIDLHLAHALKAQQSRSGPVGGSAPCRCFSQGAPLLFGPVALCSESALYDACLLFVVHLLESRRRRSARFPGEIAQFNIRADFGE